MGRAEGHAASLRPELDVRAVLGVADEPEDVPAVPVMETRRTRLREPWLGAAGRIESGVPAPTLRIEEEN